MGEKETDWEGAQAESMWEETKEREGRGETYVYPTSRRLCSTNLTNSSRFTYGVSASG